MREMEPIREEKRIRKDKRMREGALGAIAAAVIIAAIVAGGFLCIEKIPAGYAGIVYNGLNPTDIEHILLVLNSLTLLQRTREIPRRTKAFQLLHLTENLSR